MDKTTTSHIHKKLQTLSYVASYIPSTFYNLKWHLIISYMNVYERQV